MFGLGFDELDSVPDTFFMRQTTVEHRQDRILLGQISAFFACSI
jgi:hypothetical protein